MRVQFRMRGLLLVIVALCGVLAAVSVKLRQDDRRERAFQELRTLGFRDHVSSSTGNREVLTLNYERTQFADGELDRLLAALEGVQRPHDLGLSAGAEIGSIDFAGARVSDETLERLRKTLPRAEVRP